MNLLSGVYSTLKTVPVWPIIFVFTVPDTTSHMIIRLSCDDDTIFVPSFVNATHATQSWCPTKFITSAPLSMFHNSFKSQVLWNAKKNSFSKFLVNDKTYFKPLQVDHQKLKQFAWSQEKKQHNLLPKSCVHFSTHLFKMKKQTKGSWDCSVQTFECPESTAEHSNCEFSFIVHIRMPSSPPVAKNFPFHKTKDHYNQFCSSMVKNGCTNILDITISQDVPSEDQHTERTALACPRFVSARVATNKYVFTDQILTVLSWLPEAMNLPSGEYATLFTLILCPFSVTTSNPVSTFQIFVNQR